MTSSPVAGGDAPVGSPAPSTAAHTIAGRAAAIVLAVVLIAAFMDLLDATIVSVAAPAIAADLGAGEAALQWILAGYTLALGAGLITVAASGTSSAADACSSPD
ncbi:MAG: hypothetical protein LH603_05855 [Pseudonocardia sp.]|nr:hypothetical protein [Pseudonocardia sp.]